MLKEFRTLFIHLRAHRYQYTWGLIFLVITDAAQLYLPQLIRKAIDIVSRGEFSVREVLSTVLVMIAVAILVALGRYLWRYFINSASRQIELEIRQRLFTHFQRLSSTFYGANKTGDLMAHVTNDVNAVRMATGYGIAMAIDGLIMATSVLIIMLNLNSRMALLSLSPLPILSIGMIFFGKIVGELFTKVQEGFSSLSDMVQESFSGVRVLKTFVQEPSFVRRFAERNADYSARNLRLVRSWGFFYPAVGLLSGLTGVLFLFLGGRSVMEGTMSAGEFTAFYSYLQMLIWPLLGAGYVINMLQRAGASLKRINTIMNEKPDIESPPEGEAVTKPIRGDIAIRGLDYAYPTTDKQVLRGIDLEIPAGTTLGVLGKTGAGKSTLINLIPRVLDPPPGTVFIDGVDVRSYDLANLRHAVAMVPQDSFLFSATIRENIGFADPAAGDEKLERAAHGSTISRDFAVFPDGWKTVVGERGVTLSGGQKQRVAISRAIAADPAIIIFDDALSSVDTETEDIILNRLPEHIEGKTFIIVSHRISTLKLADYIVVIEDGVIAQQGTHAELLARPGFYADVYRLQQLEESMRRSS